MLAWRLFQLLTVAALVWAGWRLLGHIPYRIDIDVYRMGGQAWLDGRPLYSDGVTFSTRGGLDLPFTYPPLAAVLFSPFALLSLEAASIAITLTTLLLLIVATTILLTRLDVWPDPPGGKSAVTGEPAWLRRAWLAAAIVAPAVIYFEPIRSNFDFGQINVVLMTLVIADCVPRKTPWPRGMLLGLAIALKLTPAVFLLYFLLRRDTRALVVTAASAVVATLAGLAFAWRDSLEYWTETVRNTDRIGTATLNTNQNIAGALARLGLGESARFVLWTVACFAVLAVTVWAARRVLESRPAGAGVDLCGDVRTGGLAGVVVTPLGMGTADGAGHRRRGVSAAACGAGPRVRGGHRADGLDADSADARTPRDRGVAVATAGRRVLCVVGDRGDHRGGHRGGASCAAQRSDRRRSARPCGQLIANVPYRSKFSRKCRAVRNVRRKNSRLSRRRPRASGPTASPRCRTCRP